MASIADILIAKGNAAAQAANQRGNIYADLIRNLTSVPGQVIQQQRQYEQDELRRQILQQQAALLPGQQQLQQQQIQQGQMALQASQRDVDAEAILGQVPRTPDGLIDIAGVEQLARQHNPGLVPHVTAMAQKLNAATGDYQIKQMALEAARADRLGEVGLQVLQQPGDLGSWQLAVTTLGDKGLIPKDQVQRLLAGGVDPGFVAQTAQQWVRGSKEARAAVAPKVVMQAEGQRALIQQTLPDGSVTLTPAPGIPENPKPPTAQERDLQIEQLLTKERQGTLTPAEQSALQSYRTRTNESRPPRSLEEQLLEAVVKGDRAAINNISTALQTAARARQDPAAAATARELANLRRDEAQARLDKMKADAQPLDISTNVQTTISGKQYLDTSLYQGSEHNKAVAAAAKLGIPALSKEQASALQEVDNARANQRDILNQITDLLPSGAATRPLAYVNMKLGQIFQTNEQIAAFGSWRTAAINTLRATAGSKGLRINQAEIAQAIENDLPRLTDTLGVAKQKVANINKLLDNVENSITVRDRTALATPPAGIASTTGPDLKGLAPGAARKFSSGPYAGQTWTLGPDGNPVQVQVP